MLAESRRKYPNMFKYIEVLQLQAKLDNSQLFTEAGELGSRLKESMFTGTQDRQADHLSKIVQILRKLFHLEVNREELDFFHKRESEFHFSSIKETLSSLSRN